MAKICDIAARIRPGRLSAEDAARLPDRLMDAAFGLFSANGYAATTMEEIARAAGASTKTLYSRYANKGELLVAVVNRIIERSLAAHAAATSADPAQVEPRTFLVSLGTQFARGISGEGKALNQLALAEARRFPELSDFYLATLKRGQGIFQQALEAWRAQGLLPDMVDTSLSARLGVSMVADVPRIRSALGVPLTEAEQDAHVAHAVDHFLRGCGYRPRTAL